jgi:hypothetical protein
MASLTSSERISTQSARLRVWPLEQPRAALANALEILDRAIKAAPPGSVQDAQGSSDAGHEQLEATDASTAQARVASKDYDDEAAAMTQQASDLPSTLTCSGA